MASLYNRITPQRVFIWLVTFLGIVLAPALGYFTCTMGWTMDLIVAGVIAVAAWTFIARDRWWVPFPAALAFGGTFYYGFKIPMHEMALLLCLFPLLLAIATRWQGPTTNRKAPSVSVFLLAAYILLHWVGSLIYNKMQGLGGATNVTRSYMEAFWPFIFFYTYYFFGNSRYIKIAFFLMYCAYILRVFLGIAGSFSPAFLYIPGINYIPPAVSMPGASMDADVIGGADLRGSCPGLLTMCLCYVCLYRGFAFRAWNFLLIAICLVGVFLGGGRIGAAVIFATPVFLAIVMRRYVLILAMFFLIFSGLAVINLNPAIIESLPTAVQRSLSSLIITQKTLDIQLAVQASNEWHDQLQKAGIKRWTESLNSFVIGNGIRPFSKELWAGGEFEEQIKVAIITGRYESAICTILATFGLLGMILYLNVFRYLLTDSFPLLWKEGVHNYTTAFAFYITISVIIFCAIGYFSGGYPAFEIMMGLFAKTLHDDELAEQRQLASSTATTAKAF